MDIRDVLASKPEWKEAAAHLAADPDRAFPVLSAKFKLTWQCNLRCVMCLLWRKPNIKGRTARSLDPETVRQSLCVLAKQGLQKVHFSGGEVLLYPYFEDVVTHARELGLQVNITSNGTRLSKDVARFLVDRRVHTVTVSLDGPDPKIHDRIRGVPGAFVATMKGLSFLQARKKKKGRGPKLAVNTVVSRKTMGALPDMFGLIEALDADAWRILPMDTEIKSLRPTAEQWVTLVERLPQWRHRLARSPLDWSSSRSGSRAEKGKFAGVFYGNHLCYAPWFHVFVDADGRVYPCCNGKKEMTPFADLGRDTMEQALASPGRRDIRYTLAAGHRYPVCDCCDDFLDENRIFHENTRSQTIDA